MTSTRRLIATGALLALGIQLAPAVNLFPQTLTLASTEQATTAQAEVQYAPTDPSATLARAAQVATLTHGYTCTDPDTLTTAPDLVILEPVDGTPLLAVDLDTALDAAATGAAYVVTACTTA